MASIVSNQLTAFLARANDDARRLVHSLANLSDPQRAAMLAVIAAATSTPIDLVYVADEGDAQEISLVLDGVLLHGDTQNSYLIGSGCEMTVVAAPGTETHHE